MISHIAEFDFSEYNFSEIRFRKENQMFVGRTRELRKVRDFLDSKDNAMLVYGRRRVGKTRLIKEALSSFDSPVIFYQCSSESYDVNLAGFADELQTSLSQPFLSFRSFYDAFSFLISQKRKIVVVIDEYGEFKKSYGPAASDSMLQKIIDSLKGTDVKIIVSGSAVAMMRELLEEQNPLFDRFGCVINLQEFDYYDASLFFPSLSSREKVSYYSIFGGSPNMLEAIDISLSLEENIEQLLLAPDGRGRSFVERSLLQEYGKIGPALSLFQTIGNGKRTYTEIKDRLDPGNTGILSKQLDKFIGNDVVRKVSPINHKDGKKRTFYTLSENLMRFYFTYVHPNRSQIEVVGEDAVFRTRILPSLDTFISYRFEEIVRSFFSRMARKGMLPGIMDIGTYWYDDRSTRQNGEFDCVLEFMDGYDVYEVKYLRREMSRAEADEEASKIRNIRDFKPRHIGFVSIDGFDFHDRDFSLVTGNDLFADDLGD